MKRRALVLSGGGPVGIAWEAGILAGLAEEEVDVSKADLIVGTSAGSVVGAQLALGRPAAALPAAFLKPGGAQQPSPSQTLEQPPNLSQLIAKMTEAASGSRPAQEVRAEIGAWAMTAKTIGEEDFVLSLGRSLSGLSDVAWPEREYICTAVDALDGSFKVWDRKSGVGLARAVASSCAVPSIYPPITIAGRRYMDGGLRSVTNADLADGYEIVMVVAVTSSGNPNRAVFFKRLENELEALTKGGSQVQLITPDEASQEAFGPNLMDPSRRPAAALSGVRQGRAEAGRVRKLWDRESAPVSLSGSV